MAAKVVNIGIWYGVGTNNFGQKTKQFSLCYFGHAPLFPSPNPAYVWLLYIDSHWKEKRDICIHMYTNTEYSKDTYGTWLLHLRVNPITLLVVLLCAMIMLLKKNKNYERYIMIIVLYKIHYS